MAGMRSASSRPVATPDSPRLAKTRERFLTEEPVDAEHVRDTILASWWRSRSWNVAPDHVQMAYVRDPDLDTPLSRSALPVLRSLLGHLEGQPISVILTDAKGLVLSRLSADKELERHLERVQLAPGFCYAEQFVGTNGIGTALEGGGPMHVFGHEHYAENLENLACAAVPIQHPITGKTVGAVDLTCWRKDAGQLLIALAKTTSDQIRQALLMDGGELEYQLLQAYLKACRRNAGSVFALNGDVVMMNDHARMTLGTADQAVLLQHASEALATGRSGAVVVALPSGSSARMHCSAVGDGGRIAGGVAHVKMDEPVRSSTRSARPPSPGVLPGLVGSGALWVRARRQVEAALAAGEWLAIDGEQGVGKVAVVRAVHLRGSPACRVHVSDSAGADRAGWLAELRSELEGADSSLVLRHVDRLGARRLRSVTTLLEAAQEANTTVHVTVTLGKGVPGEDLRRLLALFPTTVRVPPLRHHIEDINALVPSILARLADNRLEFSTASMQMLARFTWPGNTAQLVTVLRDVVQRRRTGVIEPEDLPAECRAMSRRVLTPIEALERDAIVGGILDADGNKGAAAAALGMSRATIYRKIHEYGIVT